MQTKIKVAHVIRVFSYGGAEILLKELLSTQSFKDNCISDLYILDHKKLGLLPEVKNNIRQSFFYRITTFRFLFEYISFLRKIIGGKYDVVHTHLPVAAWMTIPAKLFCRKTKFIYTEHTLISFYSKYNYYLSALTYGWQDCVISVSKEVSDEIEQRKKGWFFKRKYPVIILNGVNTDKFFVADRNKITDAKKLRLGLVARFRPNKRLDRWIEVADEIHKRNKDVQFIVFGDGPDEENVRNKVAERNLNNIIQLPGKTHDTLNAYRQMDMFLLTSDQEGLPLSLMEAMSCGCVPAVNDVGGIKQLELNGTGFKFNSYDPVNIAERILTYTQQPEKYFKESNEARAFVVRNYSINRQADETIELYRQLMTAK